MSHKSSFSSVSVNAHGLCWKVVTDFADILPQIPILRLRAPDSLGSWELVKDNKHRTVVRASDPVNEDRPGLYLKRYKLSKISRRLKHLVRPTHAAQEWSVSQALHERNIPTCRVLAVAERRPGLLHREAFLISREIPDAITVSDYLENKEWMEQPYERRVSLVDELADLTARMIRRGVGHADMHVGNVMIRPDAPSGERLFVLDLHRVRIGRIRRKDVVRMLVYLADSTKKRGVEGRARIRFLRRILRRWKGEEYLTKKRLRKWNLRVRKAWAKHYRRQMRSRTKRCLVDSSEFTPDVTRHYKVHRLRDFPLNQALKFVHGHELALDGLSGFCEVVKVGSRTAVTGCEDAAGGRIFIKAFCRKPITERLKGIARFRSRARRAWVAHRAFRVRDVPAVPALCVMEARNKLMGRPDYLITRDPGVMADLEVLAKAQAADHPAHEELNLSAEQHRRVGVAVADLFRRMADSRVRHRDMKPSNILVKEREEGGFDLWLVDMDRAVVEVEWTEHLWMYHLAQCNAGLDRGFSLLDRMRCLRDIGRDRWTAEERLSVARGILDLSLERDPMWLRDCDN